MLGDALKEVLRTPSRSSPGGSGRGSSQRRHSHSGTPVEREDRVRGSSVMDLVRNFESTIKKRVRRPPLQPVLSERSKPTKGDDSDDNTSEWQCGEICTWSTTFIGDDMKTL